MQSLSQLNGFSQAEAISVTDLRKARVVFNETPNLDGVNQVIQIASTTVTVNPGIEILDVINYTLSQPTFTIEITTAGSPALSGSTISWTNSASWPAYLTVAQVGSKYTVSGIRSAVDWAYIRQFVWNLPSNWASCPSFRIVCRINYYDEATNKNVFKQWYVYDPDNSYIAELSSTSTMTIKGSYFVRSNRAALTSSAIIKLDQPLTLQVYKEAASYTQGPNYAGYVRVVGTGISIDWGDGSAIQVLGDVTWNDYSDTNGKYHTQYGIRHIFPDVASVYYTIKIYGNITRFESSFYGDGYGPVLTQVIGWPHSAITAVSLAGAQLSYVPPFLPKTVTSLYQFLSGANAIATGTAETNIAAWNTQNVTVFTSAFAYGSYNIPIQNWDTRSAQKMDYMFFNNTAFNQPINTVSNKWNTSNVYDMTQMFSGTTAFNQSISNWNTINVSTMSDMFKNATAFNQPLTRSGNIWNTVNVNSLEGMFNGATSFNQDLSNWNVLYTTVKPYLFDNNTPAWNKTNRLPRWGTNGT